MLMPMFLVGFEQHPVARSNHFDGAASAFGTDSVGNVDGLGQRVTVPVGARSRNEVVALARDGAGVRPRRRCRRRR